MDEAVEAWLQSGGDPEDIATATIELAEPIRGQARWRPAALRSAGDLAPR